ncbi:hypothetical protein BDY19DRAFT_93568 [Irpex rosettiformis]|uniref:Uncharacterized protein n=1 Tax=Irpex rosettiformis TaxID=378272 RepID=A0ACB8U6G7_9APHY|nr:hypothetical protein BDY19DRAFT_93568 [Irpex rosettiformis]
MRKLLAEYEKWSDEGGCFRHVGYTIAWEENGEQYLLEHEGKTYDLDKLDAPPLVPPQYLTTTPWLDTYHEAPQPLPPDAFVKSNSVIRLTPDDPTLLSQLMRREIQVYMTISHSPPHPNICPFYGCVRDGNRATGLVLKKILHELPDKWCYVEPQRATPKLVILKGVKRGLDHLHNLGIIHNDINKANILLDDNLCPVIVDFNTALSEGEARGEHQGTPGWFRKNRVSRKENDTFALGLLAKWLDGWEEDPSRFIEPEEPCSWTEGYLAPKIIAAGAPSPSRLYNSILSRAFYSGARVTLLNSDSRYGLLEVPSHLLNAHINSVPTQSYDEYVQAWTKACEGLRSNEVDVIFFPISSGILSEDSHQLSNLRNIITSLPQNMRPRRMQPKLILFDTDSTISSRVELEKLEYILRTLVRDCWTPEIGGTVGGGRSLDENEDTAADSEALALQTNNVFSSFVLVQPGGWFSWGRLRLRWWHSMVATGPSFERTPCLVAPDDLIDLVLEPPAGDIADTTQGSLGRYRRESSSTGGLELLRLIAIQVTVLSIYTTYILVWNRSS